MKEINNRKFYSAVEAYNMTKEVEEKHILEELNDLFDKIDTFVRVGQYECETFNLSEFQKNWLIENGYTIDTINMPGNYKDGMIKISWK